MSRILKLLKQGADLAGNVMFLVMFGAFILQVFTRYVLNHPLAWTEELCKLAFLWFVFWGAGVMLREKDHVRFDIIYQSVSPKAKRVMAIVVSAAMAALFLIGLPANFDYVRFMGSDRTWILEIRFDIVFSVFVVFIVGYAVYNLIRLRRLLGQNWKNEI